MTRTNAERTLSDREAIAERTGTLPPGFSLAGPAQHAVAATFTRLERHRDAVTRQWRTRYRDLVGREWTPREVDLAPRLLERVHRALARRDFRGYTSAIEEVALEFARDRLGPERLLAFLEAHQESVTHVLLSTLRVSPAVSQTLLALLRIQHYTLWRVLAAYEPAGERRGSRGFRDRGSRVTPRELEIIRHIAEGMTSKEIADKLGTSLKTIETHRQNIFRKLELGNAAQLVRYAIREGLVRP
ncbi:MAG TPA: response regulator transcription factor [Methylomirabilota bacterium]|jgi:DNA-binding CsgD family transcriptional regulator|nr:response regulator transcription factor [Methylomirabilota bacterium]